MKYFLISLIFLISLFLELGLYSRWQADIDYTIGKSYSTSQKLFDAYPYLKKAVQEAPDEPTFKSELSYNQAGLAAGIYNQLKNSTDSALTDLSNTDKMKIKIPQIGLSVADLSLQAIENSNEVVTISPNSLPFWKDRLKIFFQLSSIDKKYDTEILNSINKASILAPTDAKVHYLKAWILDRAGKTDEAIKILQETLVLKPDYNDAKVLLEKIEKSQK